MANPQIVFVVGAGASQQLGFPIGADLCSELARELNFQFDGPFAKLKNGNSLILRAIEQHVKVGPSHGSVEDHVEAAHHIRDAMSIDRSIDRFVNSQGENERIKSCAKLAIAAAILSHEATSRLSKAENDFGGIPDVTGLAGHWYRDLANVLWTGRPLAEVPDRFSRVKFVIFNYDRCVEQCLYLMLRSYYRISTEDASGLMSHTDFFHPYGHVGFLPWQKKPDDSVLPFGIEPDVSSLLKAFQWIRTFSEGTNPQTSNIDEIKSAIGSANKIVFLGFGYDDLNLQLLKPKPEFDSGQKSATYIWGTVKDMPQPRVGVLQSKLTGFRATHRPASQVKFAPRNQDCATFFQEYSSLFALDS